MSLGGNGFRRGNFFSSPVRVVTTTVGSASARCISWSRQSSRIVHGSSALAPNAPNASVAAANAIRRKPRRAGRRPRRRGGRRARERRADGVSHTRVPLVGSVTPMPSSGCAPAGAADVVVIQWWVWCQGVVGRWVWGSGGCRCAGGMAGVGGVEVGVEGQGVVGVAVQGAQGVVVDIAEGVGDGVGQQWVRADLDEAPCSAPAAAIACGKTHRVAQIRHPIVRIEQRRGRHHDPRWRTPESPAASAPHRPTQPAARPASDQRSDDAKPHPPRSDAPTDPGPPPPRSPHPPAPAARRSPSAAARHTPPPTPRNNRRSTPRSPQRPTPPAPSHPAPANRASNRDRVVITSQTLGQAQRPGHHRRSNLTHRMPDHRIRVPPHRNATTRSTPTAPRPTPAESAQYRHRLRPNPAPRATKTRPAQQKPAPAPPPPQQKPAHRPTTDGPSPPTANPDPNTQTPCPNHTAPHAEPPPPPPATPAANARNPATACALISGHTPWRTGHDAPDDD